MCSLFTALISAISVSVYAHVISDSYCRPAEKHDENRQPPQPYNPVQKGRGRSYKFIQRREQRSQVQRSLQCQSQSPNSSSPEVLPPREPSNEQSQPAAPSPPLYRNCLRTRTTGTHSPNPTNSVRRHIPRAASCRLAMARSPAVP